MIIMHLYRCIINYTHEVIMTVAFFGHSETPSFVEPTLRQLVQTLIIEKGAARFLVGNQGGFDHMTVRVLRALSRDFNNIDYAVVLAYLPSRDCEYDERHSLYPEGMEAVPPRFAICKRNEWMIKQSDIVVVYVTHSFGGAARYKEIAEKKGKIVINLAGCI